MNYWLFHPKVVLCMQGLRLTCRRSRRRRRKCCPLHDVSIMLGKFTASKSVHSLIACMKCCIYSSVSLCDGVLVALKFTWIVMSDKNCLCRLQHAHALVSVCGSLI